MQDYYKTLGVEKTANDAQIRSAFRKLSLEYHPDKNPNGTEIFQKINEAYENLSDPDKRKEYDMKCEYENNGGGVNMFPFGFRTSNENMDMGGIPEHIINMMTGEIFNHMSQQHEEIDIIHLALPIALQDIYGGKKFVIYERLSLVNSTGLIVKNWANYMCVCDLCKGTGITYQTTQKSFFIQRSSHPCNKCHKGWSVATGYKLEMRKCKMEYDVVTGTLNNSVKIIEGEGNITKYNGKFIRGNVAIIIKYDIAATNAQLLASAQSHNIKYIPELNDVDDNGDMHYMYSITALELIIGTEFNLILPTGRIMLIKIPNVNLSDIKTIKNHGLPQLLFESSNESENKNIIIHFIIRDHNYNCTSETKKYLLEQFSSQIPQTHSDGVILVKFER